MEPPHVHIREALENDRKDILRELSDAWYIHGHNPWHHENMKKKLQDEWPVLYNAIEGTLARLRQEWNE
jgi:hypothetical protein